jgi:hypothetical protein
MKERIKKINDAIDSLVTVWQGFGDLTDEQENKILDAENMLRDLLKNQKQEVCKCGHNESQHNMGGKYACLIDYNDDGCLEFMAKQS